MKNGLLRTMANLGMLSSFTLVLLLSSISTPREDAFEIFVGVGKISGQLSSACITGLHTAPIASIFLLLVVVVPSVMRGRNLGTRPIHLGLLGRARFADSRGIIFPIAELK